MDISLLSSLTAIHYDEGNLAFLKASCSISTVASNYNAPAEKVFSPPVHSNFTYTKCQNLFSGKEVSCNL